MAYVIDAMKGESSIQDKLLCVSRLRVIALALGEEKTRTQLLPFLRNLREPPVRGAAKRGSAPTSLPRTPLRQAVTALVVQGRLERAPCREHLFSVTCRCSRARARAAENGQAPA